MLTMVHLAFGIPTVLYAFAGIGGDSYRRCTGILVTPNVVREAGVERSSALWPLRSLCSRRAASRCRQEENPSIIPHILIMAVCSAIGQVPTQRLEHMTSRSDL